MNKCRYVVAKIKPWNGHTYLTIVRVVPIQKISNFVPRECPFQGCSTEALKTSAYCYNHWYDVMYNPSKVKSKDGKIYSLRKTRKKKEKKNAKSRKLGNKNGDASTKRKGRKRRKGPQDALGFDLF